jgi:futalosine hydrolase
MPAGGRRSTGALDHAGPAPVATFRTMSRSADLLVIAATARELAVPDGWRTLLCGVGPVEAAAATAAALATRKPAAVLHVGIAGARRDAGLAPPALVIGSHSLYCDLGVPAEWAPHQLDANPELLAAARRALPDASVRPIGTSARVGGSHVRGLRDVERITAASVDRGEDAPLDVEAMEGFGVLRAAQLAGVPAVEVRAISNLIDEPDRARWRFDDAFAAITNATPRLVAELLACVR